MCFIPCILLLYKKINIIYHTSHSLRLRFASVLYLYIYERWPAASAEIVDASAFFLANEVNVHLHSINDLDSLTQRIFKNPSLS